MSTGAENRGVEKQRIFETVLSSPGMSEKCKIMLQLSRQNVLLLGRLIEAGLLDEERRFKDEILAALPKESMEEWRLLHEEILMKSNLTNFYDRLKSL